MAHQMNDEIKDIGIKFYGHTNTCHIIVVGLCWQTEIPMKRVSEFARLFPDIHWEDGEFLNRLKGRYVRVTFDDDMKLHALHHITKSLSYYIHKNGEEKIDVKDSTNA